jgi:Raf kinase inhibitor-like YbhB/YbcL family protein
MKQVKNMKLRALVVAVALLSASASAYAFKLSSSDISPGKAVANKFVFKGFGCDGENLSPALAWSSAPKDTKSFAILVHDPDAPTGGSGWWHWVAYNIPAATVALAQGAGKSDGSAMPKGSAQGITDFGSAGYGGPCPPQGDKPHRYIFTLHALRTEKLDIPAGSTAALAGFMVNANSLAKATLTVKFGRK